MERLQEIIPEILNDINDITDCFYQQKTNEGYLVLISVIDRLTGMMDYISQIKNKPELIDKNNKMMSALNDATEALSEKDTVLLADIFKYDITDCLQEILTINRG